MIALDAATGQTSARFGKNGVVDLRSPEVLQGHPDAALGVTSAPVIYKNLVITGSRTQETPQKGASGRVRAFDVITGREVWHFNGVPQPGEKFHETWEGDSWKERSGVNVWVGLTLDAQRGIAYLPFGAPTFDQSGNDRKGDSLFANTLVAVDAATGRYLWHFQVLRHDLWDYDLPLTTLLDVKKDGRTIPAVAVMSKASLLFLLDRVTGKPIYPVRDLPVPTDTDMQGEKVSPTQPASITPPLGRTSFDMSELANLTPQQKAGAAIEKRGQREQRQGEKLEKTGEHREARGDKVEAKGERSEARGAALSDSGKTKTGAALQRQGNALENRGNRVENQGNRMEKRGERREGRGVRTEKRGDSLKTATKKP